jgi:hypothetical protein
MSFEEDTYNTIFKAMQHPIRRRILRTIADNPSTYTEIQKDLNIDNGLLNYHLDALSSLITKNPEDKYTLSDFGRATTGLIRGVEEPSKTLHSANPPVMKWLVVILAVALVVSGVWVNTSSLELTGLQNEKMRLEEKLRDVNATLISTQKTPLVEASLNQLITSLHDDGNVTLQWMWILDSSDVDSVDVPYSMSGVDIRLVSQDDVKSMAMKSNGTRVYSLDEVSLTDSTHGVVKVSQYYVYNVDGIPSIYSAMKTTDYLERRAGDWVITGGLISFEDYFRAIPLF